MGYSTVPSFFGTELGHQHAPGVDTQIGFFLFGHRPAVAVTIFFQGQTASLSPDPGFRGQQGTQHLQGGVVQMATKGKPIMIVWGSQFVSAVF